jgi:ketosteroid isomerase-like protein
MRQDTLRDFEQFLRQREAAAGAYVRGDAGPLGEVTARTGEATFFAPRGGSVKGAEQVWSTYERDANSFAPGGESSFEILQIGASGELAFWTGFQRASAFMRGQADAVPFNLRVTEVFRREGDQWKLVHRHADPLASEAREQKK